MFVFHTFIFRLTVLANSFSVDFNLCVYLAGCLLSMYILNSRFNGQLYVLMIYEFKLNCFLSVLASVNGGVIRTEGVL